MRITTVEASSDDKNYVYGYQVVALPDSGEKVSMFLAKGFTPASQDLSLYILCRLVRVPLKAFTLLSENRRIIRKCKSIEHQLIPRHKFEYTSEWREFCKKYTDARIGEKVVSYDRLDSWFNSQVTTHIMLFTDSETSKPVGLVTLYVEDGLIALYSRSFYDLEYFNRNLGMYQMVATVAYFAEQNFKYIYLGTCYSKRALYKTQFKHMQFFNGFRWSDNIKELKYLIQHNKGLLKDNLALPSEFSKTYYTAQKNLFNAAEVFWH